MAGWCDDSVQPSFIFGDCFSNPLFTFGEIGEDLSSEDESNCSFSIPVSCSEIKKNCVQTVDGSPVRTVYVSAIPIDASWSDIKRAFRPFGHIVKLYVKPKSCGSPYAFITFQDTCDAMEVLNHKVKIKSRLVNIAIADSWHQPVLGPDGELIWTRNKESFSEEDEENSTLIQVQPIEDENSVNKLNDDCLTYILSFLSYEDRLQAEIVCKRWQALISNLWRRISIIDFSQPAMNNIPRINASLECLLKKCNESVRMLNLTCLHSFDETILVSIAKYCTNVEELFVSKLYLSKRSLPYLAKYCKKLKKIELLDCSNYRDSDLVKLFATSTALTSITLTRAKHLTGQCLEVLKTPVEYLNLNYCIELKFPSLKRFIQQHSSSLKHLYLNTCISLSENDFKQICTILPNLLTLSIANSGRRYNSHWLIPICDLSHLQVLNVSENNINKRLIAGIVQNCTNLLSLDISGSRNGNQFSHEDLFKFAKLRKLVEINLSYLNQTNDDCLKHLVTKYSPCRLKVIKCVGCPNVTDAGCTQVVSLCHELELFDISGNRTVTDETLKTALHSIRMNSYRKPLTLVVGGTRIEGTQCENESRLIVCTDNNFLHPSMSHYIDTIYLEDDFDMVELCYDMDMVSHWSEVLFSDSSFEDFDGSLSFSGNDDDDYDDDLLEFYENDFED